MLATFTGSGLTLKLATAEPFDMWAEAKTGSPPKLAAFLYCVRAIGSVDIKFFDLTSSICGTLRFADAGTHGFIVAVEAIGHLRHERFVVHLSV